MSAENSGLHLATSPGVVWRICLHFHPRQICLRQIHRGRISPGKLGPKTRQIPRGQADVTRQDSNQADCSWPGKAGASTTGSCWVLRADGSGGAGAA
ncbi:hypothetical protein CCANI_09195 [Corynebacterium canis]|nr:hypothetical protein CCANI_09195 [Corynebacterium canis]